MDMIVLRDRLKEAIDEVFSEFALEPIAAREGAELELKVGSPEPAEGFDFRWPEEVVHYEPAYRLSLDDGVGQYSFLVGWQTRPAFGKADRGRWIVFHQWGGPDSAPYPVAEFTETDDEGRFAAIMLAPGGGRKRLYPDDELPRWFDPLVTSRTDELYESVNNGPSLRVVVDDKDFTRMIVHGYWMARVRAILPGGPPDGGFRVV
jgi:hypothetical protein